MTLSRPRGPNVCRRRAEIQRRGLRKRSFASSGCHRADDDNGVLQSENRYKQINEKTDHQGYERDMWDSPGQAWHTH
uniref:SFRICE_015721 n=1 Tax=Spodoptera frugiperda TaxID=7108 RepID=A0A2H1VUB5_SPOFR